MTKLLSAIIAGTFAVATISPVAMAQGAKDEAPKKTEKKGDEKKKADDKKKAPEKKS